VAKHLYATAPADAWIVAKAMALRGAEKVKPIARTRAAGSPGLADSLGAAD
jgi:hypothetical protein